MFLAHEMVKIAGIQKYDRVLEPSAGGGNLAMAAVAVGARVTCVELNKELAMKLRNSFIVFNRDFLSMSYSSLDFLGRFDAVLMCPPKNSIPHVDHAITFLRPGGKLVALVRKDSQNIEKYIDNYHPLPYDMFQIDGKNVESGLIVYENPESNNRLT
jgi:protein-L-isoaspartate O-methyltransferase